MKKVVPDGTRIKSLRLNSERASTQKELSHEVRISERRLRQIENKDSPVGADVLDRFAKWFGVHREHLAKSGASSPIAPAPQENVSNSVAEMAGSQSRAPRSRAISGAATLCRYSIRRNCQNGGLRHEASLLVAEGCRTVPGAHPSGTRGRAS